MNPKLIVSVLVLAASGIFSSVRAADPLTLSPENRDRRVPLNGIIDFPPDPSAVYPGDRFKHDETYRPQLKVDETNEPWKSWFSAINKIFSERFALSYGARIPAQQAVVIYRVTNDRQIYIDKFVARSPDRFFNLGVSQTVKSLSGQPILQFPGGYNGLLIESTATFKSTQTETHSRGE